MSPEAGEQLMLWTIRVGVACYAAAAWLWLFSAVPRTDRTQRRYAFLWTLAWLLCVLHVICAFHFRHHWDHDRALQHTAEMTFNVVGLHWAGGLYINYVFLACWGLTVLTAWRPDASSSWWQETGFHAFAAFMMFNATAVFGPAWWWGPVLLLLIAMIVCRTRQIHGASRS